MKSLEATFAAHRSIRQFRPDPVPQDLIEIELFGIEKGTLPGIDKTRRGKVELMAEGTLLIEEIEEMPIVRSVENELGDPARLASLSSNEANALRRRYFDTLAQVAPPGPGQRVLDKFPFHMARMGVIHRIFPDAKVIFAERHPCDCVLSAFMSNFELNRAMLSFTSLEGAAKLYDLASIAWPRAEANLPIEKA